MTLKDFIKNRLKGYSQSKFDDIVSELVSEWQYTKPEAIDLMHANQELLDQLDKDGVDVKTIVAMLLVTENQKTPSKTETYSLAEEVGNILMNEYDISREWYEKLLLRKGPDNKSELDKLLEYGYGNSTPSQLAKMLWDRNPDAYSKTKSSVNAYSKSDTTKLSSLKSWAEVEELLTQIGFKKDKASYHEGKCLNSFGIGSGTKNPKDEFFYHEAIMPKVESYFLTCSGEDDEGRGTFLGEDIIGCISKDPFTKSIYFNSTKETTIGDLKKIIEESNGEGLLNVSGDNYLNFKVIKIGE